MRSYGVVVPSFWTRGSGKSLRGDPAAQTMALYLMTCPSSSMTGLYYLALPTMLHEVGCSFEGACKALQRVFEVQIAVYDQESELIWTPNAALYQIGDHLKPADRRVVGVRSMIQPFSGHQFYLDFLNRYNGKYNLGLGEPEQKTPSPFEAPYKPLRRVITRSGQDRSRTGTGQEGPATTGALTPKMPLPGDHVAPAPPGAGLTVQEQGRAARKGQPARHIGPDTPPEGLDQIDLCRRGYAILWQKVHGDNGAVFPDQPGADRDVMGGVLGYHRRNKLEWPWKAWVTKIFEAYLSLGPKEDKLAAQSSHALRFLPACMPMLVVMAAKALRDPQG